MYNAFVAGVAVGTIGSSVLVPLAAWTIGAVWGVGASMLWPRKNPHRNRLSSEDIALLQQMLNNRA